MVLDLNEKVKPAGPALLVVDTSYTLEAIETRDMRDSITCRDLDGFFSHVWSVHPFAPLTGSRDWSPRFGRATRTELEDRHTFIEGKLGRFAALQKLFLPNFLLGQMSLFLTLARLIRRERIAIVRAGDPLYAGLFSWALAKVGRARFVIRVNGNNAFLRAKAGIPIYPKLMRRIWVEEAVERFVFRRADLVIVPNQNYLEFAVAGGAPVDRVVFEPFGILLDRRHFQDPSERSSAAADLASLGLRPGRFFLHIGRLIPLKHPDHLVRALARIRAGGHDVKLVLVGEGPMRQELEALAAELAVADAVVFAGSRDQGWLARVIPTAAGVLSASTGRALSEVALGRLPIIAYDSDWQAELIEHERSGLLVQDGDWEQMAAAAIRCLEDPELARSLGSAVRERALHMLDRPSAVEHARGHMSALLEGSGAAGGRK